MIAKKLQIRNSTADFLVFTKENNSADTIEVRVQDGNVWLTQKEIGQSLPNIYRMFLPTGNWLKVQYVQNLHKLPMTARPISINSTIYRQLLQSAIGLNPLGQPSSANGRPGFWKPLPNRDMFWIKID